MAIGLGGAPALTPEEEAALLAAGGGYVAAPVPSPAAPPVEPGMYEPSYVGPGRYAPPPPPPVEPGMYEPSYTQPGYYTPRPASTYYGGAVWPTPYTATERDSTMGQTQPGPRRDVISVYDPATGKRTYRPVPSGGTEILPGPARMTDSTPDPALTSRDDLLALLAGKPGAAARPIAPDDLGPSSFDLGLHLLLGSPGVTANAVGRPALTRDMNLAQQRTLRKRLGGLFGGGS